MVALTALARALADGGAVVWEPVDRPRLRVAPGYAETLRREAGDVREVLRRAVAFRRQLGVAAGGPIVPFLVLPEAPAPRPGACISCGVSLPAGQSWRCRPCLAAVYIALGLTGLLSEVIDVNAGGTGSAVG